MKYDATVGVAGAGDGVVGFGVVVVGAVVVVVVVADTGLAAVGEVVVAPPQAKSAAAAARLAPMRTGPDARCPVRHAASAERHANAMMVIHTGGGAVSCGIGVKACNRARRSRNDVVSARSSDVRDERDHWCSCPATSSTCA